VRVRDQVTQWASQWEVGPRGIAELRRQLLQTALAHWPQVQGATAGTRGAFAVRPAAADEAYLRGLGYISSNDPVVRDSSLAQFDEALSLDPSFARAYAGRARAQLAGFLLLRDTTRLAKGEADARRAVELEPDEAEGRLALAQILQNRGRTREALGELRGVAARNQYNAETFKLLGECYAKLGDVKNARDSYQSALELQPTGPRVWRSYGNFLLLKAGDLAGAESAFRREKELAPDDNKGYEDVAAALIMQCRYLEAVAEFASRPEPQRKSVTLHANRGVALYFSGDHTSALRDFLEGVNQAPENADRRLVLGDVYMKLGRRVDAVNEYREARRLLERELVNQPDDVATRASFAMALAKTGDFPRALLEIDRCEAAKLEKHIKVLHVVAKALALCGERDRALGALKTLVNAGFSRCLLKAEDEFESLKGDPRFQQLVSPGVD
jgi:tetratricopeptide (TPR) repeat protein